MSAKIRLSRRCSHGPSGGAPAQDGQVYMWDTATAELKHTLLADRCVVNCVAPHPHLPLFASSGIDNEVRLPG